MSRVEFELAALRGHDRIEVDVADRVMARIATLPYPSSVPAVRSRRPAAIVASVAAAVVAAIAFAIAAPAALGGGLLQALALMRGMGGSMTVSSLSRGVAGAIQLGGSTMRAILSSLDSIQPLATSAALTLAAITVATVVLIVARDISRAPVLEEL